MQAVPIYYRRGRGGPGEAPQSRRVVRRVVTSVPVDGDEAAVTLEFAR